MGTNCFEVEQFIKKRVEIEWDMLYQEDIVTRTVHDKKAQQDFVRRVVTGCEASLCVQGWLDAANLLAVNMYYLELQYVSL